MGLKEVGISVKALAQPKAVGAAAGKGLQALGKKDEEGESAIGKMRKGFQDTMQARLDKSAAVGRDAREVNAENSLADLVKVRGG